ncbi:MAG TPA: type II toxin-antitoxin system prevent-host-death family antitoxin [Blastocatellia bacterium]|nr:type II toxin-antitoxin system prevent-host-death family antitoxin [Blastocatellia bacterium]
MHRIELDKAKLQMETLIQTALDGEEVIITRDAEPVLKLVPVSKSNARRKAGTAKGMISMTEDFDEPLEDFREYLQ